MKIFNSKNLTKQAGISLAETMIVTVILGALTGLSYSQFGSSSALVQVRTTLDASQKIAANWSYLTQVLGVSVAIGAGESQSIIITGKNTALDLVVMGDEPTGILKSVYGAAYLTSGLRPLADLLQVARLPTVAVPGVYAINGFPITLSTKTTMVGETGSMVSKNKIVVSLSAVSPEIASALWAAKKTSKELDWDSGSKQGVVGDAISHEVANLDGLVNITLAFNP
jgi:hypothetical protein